MTPCMLFFFFATNFFFLESSAPFQKIKFPDFDNIPKFYNDF